MRFLQPYKISHSFLIPQQNIKLTLGAPLDDLALGDLGDLGPLEPRPLKGIPLVMFLSIPRVDAMPLGPLGEPRTDPPIPRVLVFCKPGGRSGDGRTAGGGAGGSGSSSGAFQPAIIIRLLTIRARASLVFALFGESFEFSSISISFVGVAGYSELWREMLSSS